MLVARKLLAAGDLDREGVADAHRMRKMHRLVDEGGAGSGELGAEDVEHQRAAPHAVGDHLAQHRRIGLARIDMRGADVAGHHGVQLDVLVA